MGNPHLLVGFTKWALLVPVALAMYCGIFFGGPMINLLLMFIRGYRQEEMFTERDLRVLVHTNGNGPPELEGHVPASIVRVPRILHRTWKDRNLSALPADWRDGYATCADLHPNWTHYLWTDATARALIAEHYSWFLPTFDGYRYPIQRVDAMRYFILYHYGGIYLDLDVVCVRTLDPLLDSLPSGVALFPETEPLGVSNDVMLTPQRHPFFLHLVQSLPAADRWYGSNYPTVLFSTGPSFISVNIYWAKPWHMAKIRILKDTLYAKGSTTFFSHLPGSSWHGTDATLVKSIATIPDRFRDFRTNHYLLLSYGALMTGVALCIVRWLWRSRGRTKGSQGMYQSSSNHRLNSSD